MVSTAPRRPQSTKGQLREAAGQEHPIDWAKSPREIIKHICGLSPWPVATMALDGATLKVYRAEYTDTVTDKAPGSVVSAGKAGLEIACGGGRTVRVTELQAPGKRRMEAAAWLLGHPVK
ncbi:MAG: methionyl-tRNA formyltransferase, partial [Oscillospiraceae bacterium]